MRAARINPDQRGLTPGAVLPIRERAVSGGKAGSGKKMSPEDAARPPQNRSLPKEFGAYDEHRRLVAPRAAALAWLYRRAREGGPQPSAWRRSSFGEQGDAGAAALA